MRSMKVRLLFFAVLRDVIGTGERVAVFWGYALGTAGDVWQSLRHSYTKLAAYTQPPLVAINESYAAADAVLEDGDELAFIPPVAGG